MDSASGASEDEAFALVFGRALAAARLRAGLRQEDLAARLGGTRGPTISTWENGKSITPAGTIRKIAEALGVSADELLGIAAPDAARVAEAVRLAEEVVALVERYKKPPRPAEGEMEKKRTSRKVDDAERAAAEAAKRLKANRPTG
jgi:transcriptional regulator with XRE-family HTH domain